MALNNFQKESIEKAKAKLIKAGLLTANGDGDINVEALFIYLELLNTQLIEQQNMDTQVKHILEDFKTRLSELNVKV